MRVNAHYFMNDVNKKLHHVKQVKRNKRKYFIFWFYVAQYQPPVSQHQPET